MIPRAFNVLSFVARHLHTHGFAPTHAEIATELGLRSPPGKARNLALPGSVLLLEIPTDVLCAELRSRGVQVLDEQVMDQREMGR